MPLWLILIIDAALLYFFFGEWLLDYCLTRRAKARRSLKSLRRTLQRNQRRYRDLATAEQLQKVSSAIEQIGETLKQRDATHADLETLFRRFEALPTGLHCSQRRYATLRSWLETIVVSVAVAFCIRSLLLQPFKIPTGSMQPTLFGIHYVEVPPGTSASPNAARRLFDYLNFSKRYVDWTAGDELLLDPAGVRALPSKPLFPRSRIPYYDTGAREYRDFVFPAAPTDTIKALQWRYMQLPHPLQRRADRSSRMLLHKGEAVFRGAMESGDHLFVNRMSLAFRSPERGDVMVFSTRGLSYNEQPLGGDYYIKRLVGLPGDTLKIVDRALYVRPSGETAFHKLDAKDHPGFGKINSSRNGYYGYSALSSARHLNGEGVEYTVPPRHYFLLGDNTDNSLDCRFFGSVPRENLVGRPCMVWWPFSERFGCVDR